MKHWSPRLDVVLACWLLLGFAARIFVPAGFMLEPGDGPWPVTVCPGMTPERSSASAHCPLQDGRRSEDGREDAHDGDGACFLGAFFALAAEVDAVEVTPFRLPETGDHTPAEMPSATSGEAPLSQPRGPPVAHSLPA